MAVRVQAGRFRGKSLKVPPDAGTRPLLALIKKSIFDILAPRLGGARVLDAFAGAGSFGIEAVSRGAALVVMVENSPPVYAALRANCADLGLGEEARPVRDDVLRAMKSFSRDGEEFEIVFLDPPFAMEKTDALLAASAALLAFNGVVLLRVPRNRALPAERSGLFLRRENGYGVSKVGFYYHSNPEPAAGAVGRRQQEGGE